MKKFLLAASALSLGLLSSSASAQVNVIATTTGCFYTSPNAECTTGLANTNLNGLLTYTGGGFDVTVGPSGNHVFFGSASDNIGLLALSGSPETLDNSFLRIFVTFLSPIMGTSTDVLLGDFIFLSNGGDDRMTVNFSPAYHFFKYGDPTKPLESFEFRGATDPSELLREGDSQYLGFRIDCVDGGTASCRAPTAGAVVTVTPEPSTYALFATGLLGIFGVARRRKNKA